MADITEDQITTVRSFVGEKWDEDDIGERYSKFFETTSGDEDLSLYYTTVEVLRAALARMTLDKPTSASAEGLSYSYVTNLTTLRERLTDLETGGSLDIGRTISVGRLLRTSPR